MVEAKMLGKRYMRKQAVKDVTLTIEDGKVYALLGPNGSGKTTFMKMIAGLVKPTEGCLSYNGEKIGVESKKHVAYMSTEPFFYAYMTVKDVGKYYADFFEDFSMERYEALISRMDWIRQRSFLLVLPQSSSLPRHWQEMHGFIC